MSIWYAAQHNLIQIPDWEWIPTYIESDESLADMIHMYCPSVLHGKKYKFGVEIPKSHKSALALDKTNQNSLWDKSVKKKMDQLIDKFDMFKVLQDNEPIPKKDTNVYHTILLLLVKWIYTEKRD